MLEKHIDGGQSDAHFPGTEQDYNRCIYFEALDLLVNGMKSRLINLVIKSRSVASIYAHLENIFFYIQLTPDNSNQNRFPLDFRHTFTVIWPSLTRTLGNSNLPLTRSSSCFPSDHFSIILPSITESMFWAFKKWGVKTVYWLRKHWILNFPLTCCRHIVY